MNKSQLSIPTETITAFCYRWKVTEFAIFGSALRGDFNKQSDLDVLVTFDESSEVTLLDLAQMQIELEGIFNRTVDLVEKAALCNPYRRKAILNGSKVLYANQ